eukprot:TRINITY_DN94982_c0_g1_i1.p1 TRINITY_DN94982_c0_g1~~TRINITY_DN94982_c0_g1_i1.p1  ORF type:complete len:344 (-),score=48.39 TRINITY_DN94982_c0_g1_i1:68-1099(-)
MVRETMLPNGVYAEKASPKRASSDSPLGQWTPAQNAHVSAEKAAVAEDLFAFMARSLAGEQMLAAWDGRTPAQRPELISKCTCHIGHYTQSQIIANLLHLAVQLAMFPAAAGRPTTEQACQTTPDQSIQTTEDVGCQASCQTAEEAVQTSKEQACQTSEEQECQTEPVPGKIEYSTQAVRVGGGFHIVRQMRRSAPTPGCPSQPQHLPSRPAQADPGDKSSVDQQAPVSTNQAEVKVDHDTQACNTDVTDEELQRLVQPGRDSYAHGQPACDTQLDRYKVGSYKTGHSARPTTPEEERLYRVMRGPPRRNVELSARPRSANTRQPHSARQASVNIYPRTGGTS